ncbi:MAG: hypothetical protein NW208_03120 [Bryobacter sp.]|nr:hypothetical protein [Bryobacter sp.]
MRGETILSVLSSPAVAARVEQEGGVVAWADVDPETGGLAKESVAGQLHTETRRILLEPCEGDLAAFEGLLPWTEPREIVVEATGAYRLARWTNLAPGLRGWGENFVEFDRRVLAGTREDWCALLGEFGVAAQAWPWNGARSLRRFPGAAHWVGKILWVPAWRTAQEALGELSQRQQRQMVLGFAEMPTRLRVRRGVMAAGEMAARRERSA